jgi:DNA-binding GntR family transcriptional regulator
MRERAKTKRQEVARSLETRILTGQFAPGSKLTELKLATEIGVSQACVREALQELEGLGLVVKQPNRGTFVINLKGEDLAYIYQVRRELEPLACALAASQIKQQRLDELRGCLEEMRKAAGLGDYEKYVHADYRFHLLIWRSQRNHYLEKLLKEVCLPLFAHELLRRFSSGPSRFDMAFKQHERIIKALETRDPVLVSKVIRRIIERFLRHDLSELEVSTLPLERTPV